MPGVGSLANSQGASGAAPIPSFPRKRVRSRRAFVRLATQREPTPQYVTVTVIVSL